MPLSSLHRQFRTTHYGKNNYTQEASLLPDPPQVRKRLLMFTMVQFSESNFTENTTEYKGFQVFACPIYHVFSYS